MDYIINFNVNWCNNFESVLVLYNYFGKKIVIIGLGITGFSCVNFFISRKIMPKVIDTRLNPPKKNILPKGVLFHYGNLNEKWILESDLIVVSPGVPIFLPEFVSAKKKGIEIISDIELFCREINKPLIVVTGSNGKSTVTQLLSIILKSANIKVGVGGNIGIPALNLLKKKYDLYLLELSSFQLETTFSLSPMIATILNLTFNHMDRYFGNFKEYLRNKLKIYAKSKICVFNKQDLNTWPIFTSNVKYISFGVENADYQFNRKKEILEIRGKKFIKINELRLFGEHNYLNILAVLALLENINIPYKIIKSVLRKYTGLPHRCQLIQDYNGIQWINDSKSTNIGSTIAALKLFKPKKNLYLLLGGYSKLVDFSLLQPYLLPKNIKLYCFGKDRKKIAQIKKNSFIFNTIEECLLSIKSNLQFGDIVLFSPACSSFDQFLNFEHRGEHFIQLVKKIN